MFKLSNSELYRARSIFHDPQWSDKPYIPFVNQDFETSCFRTLEINLPLSSRTQTPNIHFWDQRSKSLCDPMVDINFMNSHFVSLCLMHSLLLCTLKELTLMHLPVGMFRGRMCLSLMERTTTTMVCLQVRKAAMMENRESIISGGRENSMHRSKLRRDSSLCSLEV